MTRTVLHSYHRPVYRPVPLLEPICTEEAVPSGHYTLGSCPFHGLQPYLTWEGEFLCCSAGCYRDKENCPWLH